MARAPRRARPRRRLQRRQRAPDSAALRGIKQGVGRAVAQAFGSAPLSRRRTRRRGGKKMAGYHPCMHDAFHQCHLPLPRPTGPYTVIRTTQLVVSDYALLMLGPTFDRQNGRWTNAAAYGVVDTGKALNSANNMYVWPFNTLSGDKWNGAQITPAAFSVQVMNPQALQTTTGIVYGGRLRTAYKWSENITKTGDAIIAEFLSYNNPRLMAAAKLAFRGVQVDAVPFNMSELANFTPVKEETATAFAANTNMYDNNGFAPIWFSNPSKIPLQYLVCCEWRVRFDPSNPAQASHIQHTHSSENIWMRCLHAAESLGNGVVDIADKVAETGNAVFNATAGAYRAGRGVRALTNGMGALALGM